MSNKSKFWYKYNGLVRSIMARNYGLLSGQIVITEYPKCGGTWLSQLLADLTDYEYPRIKIPSFRKNILHGHYLSTAGIRSGVVMWRDPRDILISHFFHCAYFKPLTSDANTRRVRSKIGLTDNDEVVFTRDFPKYYSLLRAKSIHPYFSINEFYSKWFDHPGFIHTSYERLQQNTSAELAKIVKELTDTEVSNSSITKTVSKFEFSKVSGRSNGDEVSADYLRKGIVGDWKNYLEGEVLEIIMHDLEDEITRFEASYLSGDK